MNYRNTNSGTIERKNAGNSQKLKKGEDHGALKNENE